MDPDWIDRKVRGPRLEFLSADEFRWLYGLEKEDFEELLQKGIIIPPLNVSARKTFFTWEHVVHFDIWFRKNGGREYVGMFGKCKTPNAGKPQQVYFIRAGERVKIGTANNVQSRLAALQTSSPEALELLHNFDGGFAEENALHKKFAAFRIRKGSEWFHYSPEIREYIEQLKAGGTPPG